MHSSKGNVHESVRQLGWCVLAAVVGCTSPPTTRTGAVHDIMIEEGLSPSDLVINIGDEVRWVNHRTMPVRIDLVGEYTDSMSCERGFSNFVGVKSNSAAVGGNESVSLCFSKAGVVNYNARMGAALPGGEKIANGLIRIGTIQNNKP